jgi:hypothetical protein
MAKDYQREKIKEKTRESMKLHGNRFFVVMDPLGKKIMTHWLAMLSKS